MVYDKCAVSHEIPNPLAQDLAKAMAEFDKKTKAEDSIKAKLDRGESRLVDLYAKQGRSSQFKSKGERDKYLKQQVKDVEANIKKDDKQKKSLQVGGCGCILLTELEYVHV